MDVSPTRNWCALCRQSVAAWDFAPRFGTRPLCPNCGSLPRHRLLAESLGHLEPVISTASTVIQLGPSPPVTRHLVDLVGHGRYLGLDLGLEDRHVDLLGDLTSLPLRDNSVDALIIVHVLEHIPDDAAAMTEISRVIGDRGVAVLQVPYRADRPTDEDPAAPRGDRVRRFGQADHVRWYGIDFAARLRSAGLQVSEFVADSEFEPATAASRGLSGQLWFATGVGSDPNNWRQQIETLTRRRGTLTRRPIKIDHARRLVDTEQEVRYLRRRLLSEHGQARRRDGDMRALREQLDRRDAELAAARLHLRAQRRQLKKTKRHASDVQKELNAVRSSRSYRVGHTALQPVRRLRHMISNLVGHSG